MTEPPADIDAERYLLAAMMTGGPQPVEVAAEALVPECFYRPAHQVIFKALVNMDSAGVLIDPVTLRAWIEEDDDMRAIGGAHGGEYLLDLFGLPAVPQSAARYAKLVLDAWKRRAGIEECERTGQALRRVTDPDEVTALIDSWADAMHRIRRGQISLPDRSLSGITQMVAKTRNPVIPGLLDAQERVLVVAGEGRGKTTLAHQVGFAAAAGTHPFAGTPIPPQRVMIWDFENPELVLSRRFARLAEVASGFPGWDEGNMQFVLMPGGVRDSRAAFELRDAVRRFEPHLLIAGPIYKMIIGSEAGRDGNMLQVHNRVAMFFDQLREAYGCALWLESHAPYGEAGHRREMRPEGSSMWARWPEFGLALYKATKAHGGDNGLDVERFRGDRVEGRAWPDWITRNPHSGWDWVACYNRRNPPEPPPDWTDR